MRILLSSIAALLTGLALGVPTESKPRTSITGSTVDGSALELKSWQVHLKLDSGRTFTVPLDKLCEDDRAYLTEYFGKESSGSAADSDAGQGSGLPFVNDGLAHKVGEVVGPIDAGGGSHDFLYIPRSLRAGRAAPLLHFNDAVKEHIEGAELNGWIVAANIVRNGGESVKLLG